MNKRREAREFCFQYFFHLQLPIFNEVRTELSLDHGKDSLKKSIEVFKETTNSLMDNSQNEFITEQIESTLLHYAKIEEVIIEHLKNWKLARLSKVDHTALLLGVNELLFTKTAPSQVVINESIEIGKKFGSLDSGKFLNGVLDNIATKNV